jgi:hypothetical protein
MQMVFINQYSILWSAVLVLGLVAFFLLRRGFQTKKGIKLLVVGALLVVGWLLLRPDRASTTELTQFQAVIGQGQSVLLELQSPY